MVILKWISEKWDRETLNGLPRLGISWWAIIMNAVMKI
jgi:hypothetical protein